MNKPNQILNMTNLTLYRYMPQKSRMKLKMIKVLLRKSLCQFQWWRALWLQLETSIQTFLQGLFAILWSWRRVKTSHVKTYRKCKTCIHTEKIVKFVWSSLKSRKKCKTISNYFRIFQTKKHCVNLTTKEFSVKLSQKKLVWKEFRVNLL